MVPKHVFNMPRHIYLWHRKFIIKRKEDKVETVSLSFYDIRHDFNVYRANRHCGSSAADNAIYLIGIRLFCKKFGKTRSMV